MATIPATATVTVAAPTPEPVQPARAREYIPVDVERALWERDGGNCGWVLASGEVCGSEFQVQGDHKIPVAKGGRSVLSNLRLLCRLHNVLAARREFGELFMAKFKTARESVTARDAARW